MSEKNLKDLSNNSLITIGSHTCNHKDLTKLDPKEVLNELIESKSYLENLLGKEIYSMSYPFGKYNNSVKQKVLEAGYKLAFSSKFYLIVIVKINFHFVEMKYGTQTIWNISMIN